MNVKWLLASKTVWLNLIALVLAGLALPEFIQVIPVGWLPWIGLVTGFLNVILRMLGGAPLVLKQPK